MKIFELEQHESLMTVAAAKQLVPNILKAVQKEYDDWNEEDYDTYAGGGICHILADRICEILSAKGVDCTPVSCSHEQHVYVGAKFSEGVFSIDIPYSIYETGGGFSWKKIPGVVFETGDIIFSKVSGDPDDFERYYIEETEVDEASYENNIGAMEIFKFMKIAEPDQISILKHLIDKKDWKRAWALIQGVTKTSLIGKEFH